MLICLQYLGKIVLLIPCRLAYTLSSFFMNSNKFIGEGNSNLLQDSCLENPIDRGAWWALVHGVTKSWT